MKKLLLLLFLLLTIHISTKSMSQEKPQLRVDISPINRNNPDETLEPGYIWWKPKQGKKTDTLKVEGIRCVLIAPENVYPDYVVRSGWSKSYIQNAEYKAKNGRLTFDGITLDPNNNSIKSYQFNGAFTLKIEGLPVGRHLLTTYHNCWENPSSWFASPMTIKVNGVVAHENVIPSFLQAVAANATVVFTELNVEKAGNAIEIEFSTQPDKSGTPTDASQINEFKTPLLNGFDLNTEFVTLQAKAPYPTNNDLHAEADGGSITLKWTAANENIKEHQLYIGQSEQQLTLTATLPANETSYMLNNLYSMNTYYWRVDEVDALGKVNEGQVWKFKPRQLAFPDAEGYGRYAKGGRGGVVYHVTKLSNDHTPGSLLYGLVDMEGPRTIVFDVSGIIDMEFDNQSIKPFATIAGQTAPGKGICIRSSNINLGSDIIVRHMRFKRGLGIYGLNTGTAISLNGANHTIVDHCTAAWGTDETVSGRGAKNISFQYSMITEALGITGHKNYADGTNHGYAATIDGKIGSWHHNLLVNCEGRNWSLGGGMDGTNTAIGQMDIFNNVVYNWHNRTTDGGCHEVNFVNNYYKMGPDTRRTQLFSQDYENVGSIESKWQAYISGNIRENKNHTLTQDKYKDTYQYTLSNGAVDPNTRTDQYHYNTFVNEPFFPSCAEIHTAKDAMKIVTSYSGATMPMRDEQHVRNVRETLDGSYTYVGSKSKIKGEIDSEADITEHNDGWEVWPEECRPVDWDTDMDGIPNWYEDIIGSNPQSPNQNDDPDYDGWTLLEDYLEFMAHPYIILTSDDTKVIDLKQHFAGFYGQNGNHITPSFSFDEGWENGIITYNVDNSYLIVSAINPNAIGIYQLKITVDDGESKYTQCFKIAITGKRSANSYSLVYIVDGKEVKSVNYEYGALITTEQIPQKEGYTFSGWKDIPVYMPAHDVTVTGTFTVNKYNLTYMVDGAEYNSEQLEYGSAITPLVVPDKYTYLFTGWNEIPQTMPAHDVIVTGTYKRLFDMGHVVKVIDFILNDNATQSDVTLFDLNNDVALSVGDIILMMRYILNSMSKASATRATVGGMPPDLAQYTAAQFVLQTPLDVTEQDIRLVKDVAQTHQMMCKEIEPGVFAVAVYSMTNSLFSPTNGAIIEVDAEGTHSGDLSIGNVLLAKPTGETERFDNLPVLTPVTDVERESETGPVYDLKGQKRNQGKALRKGIYIKNGKKSVVR